MSGEQPSVGDTIIDAKTVVLLHRAALSGPSMAAHTRGGE
ncbi:hypothetical protein BH09ACT6_BH09ACT6_15240 [soil metagenome]